MGTVISNCLIAIDENYMVIIIRKNGSLAVPQAGA